MTTILAVRRDGRLAMGGDGQVTLGEAAIKHTASKVRWLADGSVLVGFAGATADAFALLERFEGVLADHSRNLTRASLELAKQWRTDKVLRQLQTLMAVADREALLMISGSGDVIEPEDGILGIGSGGGYAVSAARALAAHTSLGPREIVTESLKIAAGICIHTNDQLVIEELVD